MRARQIRSNFIEKKKHFKFWIFGLLDTPLQPTSLLIHVLCKSFSASKLSGLGAWVGRGGRGRGRGGALGLARRLCNGRENLEARIEYC